MTGRIGLITGALLIVFGVAIFIPFNRARRQSYRRLEKESRRMVETDCGPVEVAVRDQGSAVLIVHGSAGGFDQGLALAEDVPAGHKIIAPSRFGYLGSPLPAGATPTSQAEALVCLLDELGIEQATVMAYSAGGPSAALLALHYPERVRGLVLISTALANEPLALPPRPVIAGLVRSDFLFWLISHPFRPVSRRLFVPAELEPGQAGQKQIDQTMENLLPIRPRAEGLLFDMFVTNTDTYQRSSHYPLEEIEVPTLIINAKDDPAANFQYAREMAQRIPSARFLAVDSGGHLMLGSSGQVHRAIEEFFNCIEQ